MNENIIENLLNKFFIKSSIVIDPSREAMRFDDCNRLVFGLRNGPETCPTAVTHEMGHLIEIDDERMFIGGWGLIVPQTYIPGYGLVLQAETCKDVERETRVAAIQYNIEKYIGINRNSRNVVSSFKYLPGFCYSPGHIGFYWHSSKAYKMNDASRIKYICNEMKRLAKEKYTIEYILNEWERKNQLLHAAVKPADIARPRIEHTKKHP